MLVTAYNTSFDRLGALALKDSSFRKTSSVTAWLTMHGLDHKSIRSLLEAVDRNEGALFLDHAPRENTPTGFNADEAWNFIASAFRTKLPELRDLVDHVRDKVECNFEANPKDLPFTRNRGKAEGTLVSIFYQETCEDLLCVAHEFGHALQIEASGHKFTPPVHREVAAFLSEMLFLEFVREANEVLYGDLLSAWREENETYLNDDIDILNERLSDAGSAYDYRMNYPLARLVAFRMFDDPNPIKLAEWFSGDADLSEYVASQTNLQEDIGMQNDLPEIPPHEEDMTAINAYRSLGIIALLDIEYLEGTSEEVIGNYYSGLLDHMKSQTLFIAVNRARKPIGYATWETVRDQPSKVLITRQAAPFGDHLELQRQLERHLPDEIEAVSHHERSARTEQIAW